MAGITGTSQIDNIQETVMEEARFTREHPEIMSRLVTKFTASKGEDDTLHVPKFGALSAYSLTEGVDMTQAQQLSDADWSVSATEVGCQVIVTRKMMRTVKQDMFRVAGRITGDAMNRKLDEDLLGLFDGLNTDLGTANAAFALGFISAARARLKGQNEPAPDPIYVVLHPYHYYDIIADIVNTSSGALQDELVTGLSEDVVKKWYKGSLFGLPVFEDGNIAVDSADDAHSAVFSKDAFVLYQFQDMDVQREYDASLRAYEINVVSDYGYAEFDGTFGYDITADASAPAS